MSDLQQLASQLPWANALEVWRMNNSLKKRRGRRRGGNGTKPKPGKGEDAPVSDGGDAVAMTTEKEEADAPQEEEGEVGQGGNQAEEELEDEVTKPLKFRVTCSRAGDKHCFTSNDAARDFGGAVQEFFQWKADMTKFDVEVRQQGLFCVKKKYHLSEVSIDRFGNMQFPPLASP